jgi:hypothetical protein
MMPADFNAAVDETLFVFREWCREHHARLSGDKAVSESIAGRLIGRSGRTLSRWIAEGRPVPRYRVCADGRRSYRLRDLAIWVEAGYLHTDEQDI